LPPVDLVEGRFAVGQDLGLGVAVEDVVEDVLGLVEGGGDERLGGRRVPGAGPEPRAADRHSQQEQDGDGPPQSELVLSHDVEDAADQEDHDDRRHQRRPRKAAEGQHQTEASSSGKAPVDASSKELHHRTATDAPDEHVHGGHHADDGHDPGSHGVDVGGPGRDLERGDPVPHRRPGEDEEEDHDGDDAHHHGADFDPRGRVVVVVGAGTAGAGPGVREFVPLVFSPLDEAEDVLASPGPGVAEAVGDVLHDGLGGPPPAGVGGGRGGDVVAVVLGAGHEGLRCWPFLHRASLTANALLIRLFFGGGKGELFYFSSRQGRLEGAA